MPRPRGGALTEERSTTIAVRVENDLAQAIYASAGGKEQTSAWLRRVLRAAVGGHFAGTIGNGDLEQSEGWRAGWVAVHKKLRTALKGVADSLEPEEL